VLKTRVGSETIKVEYTQNETADVLE
jgi:hypothetical protein